MYGKLLSLSLVTLVFAVIFAQESYAQFQKSAESAYPKMYVGAEYNYMMTGTKQINGRDLGELFPDTFNSFNAHAGIKLTKLVGIEAGISQSAEAEKSAKTGSGNDAFQSVSITKYYVDAMGYYPVQGTYFEMVGSLGLGLTTIDADQTIVSSGSSASGGDSTSLFTYRLGAGLQYALSSKLSARGMLRYEIYSDDSDVYDDAISFGLGVDYTF